MTNPRELTSVGAGQVIPMLEPLVEQMPQAHTPPREIGLQTDLTRAVSRNQLRLDYQPIVELETSAVVGYEALVRWQHPTRGRLFPRDFLALAQRSDVGFAIDEWVLTESCRQGSIWARRGNPATISVNATPEHFATKGFVEEVQRALSDSGIDPSLLLIEITECSVLGDIGAARVTLAELNALGVRVALDDFGTGYSSLADIAELAVDELKIDAGFVAGLGYDRARTAIVHAIVGLGHALGITVVAEGVEDSSQAFALRAIGCEFAQGFHFGRPASGARLFGRTT
jgi:EAL domain-containing protein (putative c-di-GMP-specific phosphodiesterase class I)